MLRGFQLQTDTRTEGLETFFYRTVWFDAAFLERETEIGMLKSTMCYCDSMTPVERTNAEFTKVMLEHLREKLETRGFVVFAIYKHVLEPKEEKDNKGNRKETKTDWILEVWHPEGKDVVGVVPSASKF